MIWNTQQRTGTIQSIRSIFSNTASKLNVILRSSVVMNTLRVLVLTMNTFRTIATFICLTVATVIMLCLIVYQVWTVAFPKDPKIEANWEEIQERAEQRSRAIKEMQNESLKNND